MRVTRRIACIALYQCSSQSSSVTHSSCLLATKTAQMSRKIGDVVVFISVNTGSCAFSSPTFHSTTLPVCTLDFEQCTGHLDDSLASAGQPSKWRIHQHHSTSRPRFPSPSPSPASSSPPLKRYPEERLLSSTPSPRFLHVRLSPNHGERARPR